MNSLSRTFNRMFIACLLVALSLSLSGTSLVLAQEDDHSKVHDIRDKATDEELREIADQIFHEKVTPEFTRLLYETLNDRQRVVITKRLAELTGASFEDVKKESLNDEQGSSRSPGYDVQMPHGTGSPNVGISSSWYDPGCDGDPGDGEYVFFANTPQTVSPSDMRWYANSSLVEWAFNYAYNGVLSTYGATLYQINVCIGVPGVTLAGGESNVRNNLRIKYR